MGMDDAINARENLRRRISTRAKYYNNNNNNYSGSPGREKVAAGNVFKSRMHVRVVTEKRPSVNHTKHRAE